MSGDLKTWEIELANLKKRKSELLGPIREEIRELKRRIEEQKQANGLRQFLNVASDIDLDFAIRFHLSSSPDYEFTINELTLVTDNFEVELTVHTEQPGWPRHCHLDGFHFVGGDLREFEHDIAANDSLRQFWSLPPQYDERDETHPFWKELSEDDVSSLDWSRLSEHPAFEFVVVFVAVRKFLDVCRHNDWFESQ